jgi:hypothetical protein
LDSRHTRLRIDAVLYANIHKTQTLNLQFALTFATDTQ